MLDPYVVLEVARNQLKTLVVATTGVTSLGATTTTYTRASGSFVDDGFVAGMEIVLAEMGGDAPDILTKVEPLVLTTRRTHSARAAAAGRSISVGVPPYTSWSNTAATAKPQTNRWFLDEDFVPGTSMRAAGGTDYESDIHPVYIVNLYGVAGDGLQALFRVATEILRLFLPGTTFTASDGNLVRVRTDQEPGQGQPMAYEATHTVLTLTVPLWVRTFSYA